MQGYVNMNHQEKLLTFYKVIYSERSIQPMAARIVAEETERMIIATKQLFYAMEVHKLLHFENADMSAVSFAMASRQGRMKKVLYARQRLMFVSGTGFGYSCKGDKYDPTYLYTLPSKQTAAGAVDILSHVMETVLPTE